MSGEGRGGATAPRGGVLAATARGAGWVVAWRMMTRLLGLFSTLVLVRLLPPGDFGLIALATAFVMALDVCVSIGVEDQIVRSRDPRPALYDTAFTLNLLRGLLLSGIVAALAWPAARFFEDPRLAPVLFALSVSAAAAGLANVGVADFRRNMVFEKEFQLQFLPRLAGITVTVGGAWLLESHWALVLGILTNRLGVIVAGYALHPYRPRLSLSAWRELAGVSAWSWATSIVTVVKDRADSLVIGRTLGSSHLGIYAAGTEMAVLPATEMVDPICRACMPGFAVTLRDSEPAVLAESYLRIVSLTALLTLPAGFGISLVAGPVVALAFGPAWTEAVPVIQIIGIACTMALFGGVSAALLSARAALRTLLGIAGIGASVRIALLLTLTSLYGLPGAAMAVGLSIVTEHLLLVRAALRTMRVSPLRFLARLRRPALAVAAMVAVLAGSGLGWMPAPASASVALLALAEAIPLGVLTYGAVLVLAWFLAGRPRGAEADLLSLLGRVTGGLSALRARVPLMREG